MAGEHRHTIWSRTEAEDCAICNPVTGDETRGEAEALGHNERLTRGLYSHIHRGGCPDELEGWSSRDWECTACAMLDEMLARFNRRAITCAECDADTFECSACGSPVDLLARRDAERDRARDAEARRVVERVEAVAAQWERDAAREKDRAQRVSGDREHPYLVNAAFYESHARILRAALAEIEEGSP